MTNCTSIANSPSFSFDLFCLFYEVRPVVHRKMRPLRRLKQKCSDRKMGDIHRQGRPRLLMIAPSRGSTLLPLLSKTILYSAQ